MKLTDVLIERMMEKRANAAAIGLINVDAIKSNMDLHNNKLKRYFSDIRNKGLKEAIINAGYTPEERRQLWDNTFNLVKKPNFLKTRGDAIKIDSATRRMFEDALKKNPDIINSPYFTLGGEKGHIINQQWEAYKDLMKMPSLK